MLGGSRRAARGRDEPRSPGATIIAGQTPISVGSVQRESLVCTSRSRTDRAARRRGQRRPRADGVVVQHRKSDPDDARPRPGSRRTRYTLTLMSARGARRLCRDLVAQRAGRRVLRRDSQQPGELPSGRRRGPAAVSSRRSASTHLRGSSRSSPGPNTLNVPEAIERLTVRFSEPIDPATR